MNSVTSWSAIAISGLFDDNRSKPRDADQVAARTPALELPAEHVSIDAENRRKTQVKLAGEDDLRGDSENYLIMEVFRREAEKVFGGQK